MNDAPPTHPSRERLSAFGLGQLDGAEGTAIESNLTACPECRTVLETLPEDTFVAKLRQSAEPAAAANAVPTGNRAGHEAPTCTNAGPATPPGIELPPELALHPRYRIQQV